MWRPVALGLALAASLFAPAIAQDPAVAQERSAPALTTTRPPEPVPERDVGEAKASRDRTQAREREWDRRMRASTKSICDRC
jgi:hypothetical protein